MSSPSRASSAPVPEFSGTQEVSWQDVMDCFKDIESFSKAAGLAARLEKQLADEDAKLAVEHSAAAEAALARLDKVETECEEFEKDVNTALVQASALSEEFAKPYARLKAMYDVQLVIQTLLISDGLLNEMQEAIDTTDGECKGAASVLTRPLLRLHVLRACMRDAVEAATADGDAGADVGSPPPPEVLSALRGAEEPAPLVAALRRGDPPAAIIEALRSAVDERLHALQPRMRSALGGRLGRALTALGWPAEVKMAHGRVEESSALGEVRAAFAELLVLQFCCDALGADDAVRHSDLPLLGGAAAQTAAEEAQAFGREPPLGGAPSGVANDGGGRGRGLWEGEPGGLWAMDVLSLPLLKRFRYHFQTRRETNRRDKPEWMFQNVASVLRLHTPFLDHAIEPMLREGLALLRAAFAQPTAQQAHVQAYKAMLGRRCPDGALVAVGGCLCAAVRGKLLREQPALISAPSLYCHTLNETTAFERELRERYRARL